MILLLCKEIEDPQEQEVSKEIPVIKDLLEVEVQLESVALTDPQVLLERLVKWYLLEAEVELEHVVKTATRETLVVLVNKDL